MPTQEKLPWWEKYTLTVPEAKEYFGIGYKKLEDYIKEHHDAKFILWDGTRPLIKRKVFEQMIDEELTTI
ncbi:MAG: excisionase [Prevotella sp.]|nr:excisionase [Prevotella sp.]